MTTFPAAVLLVLAATQAPGSRPAIPEPAEAPSVAQGTESLPESKVGKDSFKKIFSFSEDANQKEQVQAAA